MADYYSGEELLDDDERKRLWPALALSHFRILLSDAPTGTQRVADAIVAAPERDLTIDDLATVTGIDVASIPGHLAETGRLAAIVHELPHKAGAPPWNVRHEHGTWVFNCPERVAKALR